MSNAETCPNSNERRDGFPPSPSGALCVPQQVRDSSPHTSGLPTPDFSSQAAKGSNTLAATKNRKRGKRMSFRSGQSGTVVRKGQMWHGRYYVDIPGEENRRKASVSLGSCHTMKKTEAKRKLRALLEKMGLNEDAHLERTEVGARTFGSEAVWWKENRMPIFKPSSQETMGSHLDKYLL